MPNPRKHHRLSRWVSLALLFLSGCKGQASLPGDEMGSGGGNGASGRASSSGAGGNSSAGGVENHVVTLGSGPQYVPVPGFEDCEHAEVKPDCQDGWCILPPSCFVMGAPETEWHRGRYTEIQVATTLTHSIEVQQFEMGRSEWKEVTSTLPTGYKQEDDDECLEDACPINNVTWWEAITAANMLSEARGLDPCYETVNCTGDLGSGLACEGVADPEKSVYECEGYRLGTRAEAEYAAKAGTYSTWYSGNITVYDNNDCNFDENLDEIGWYCHNSKDTAHRRGQKQANRFGFHDFIGNVGEWLNEASRTTMAEGGEDPIGKVGASQDRQVFGGAYNFHAWTSKTSGLFAASWDVRGASAGFRLYRTLFEDSERSKPIVVE